MGDGQTKTLEARILTGEFALKSLKTDLQSSVLEVLIYFASEKGRSRLPTIGQFILSEVVAATIEYLNGKEYLFTYHRMEDGKEFFTMADGWERKTNKAMDETLNRPRAKFCPALGEALRELTKLNFQHDAYGGRGYNSWLYTWYKHKICNIWMESTFSLSVEFIRNVEEKIIPSLNAETIKHCEAIAEIMKKHIGRDVELINKTYRW